MLGIDIAVSDSSTLQLIINLKCHSSQKKMLRDKRELVLGSPLDATIYSTKTIDLRSLYYGYNDYSALSINGDIKGPDYYSRVPGR